MQLSEIVYNLLKWTVVLAALLSSLLLAGCDRQRQSPPPRSVAEVSTVTVQTQKIMLTTDLFLMAVVTWCMVYRRAIFR